MADCQRYFNILCNCPKCLQVRSQPSEASAVVDLPSPSDEELQKDMLQMGTRYEDLRQKILVLERKCEEIHKENASRDQEMQDKLNFLRCKYDQLAEDVRTILHWHLTSYEVRSWSSWFDDDGAQAWYDSKSWHSWHDDGQCGWDWQTETAGDPWQQSSASKRWMPRM